MNIVEMLANLYPVFKRPVESLPLWKRLRNTIILSLSFIMLSEVALPFINKNAINQMIYTQMIFGASFGTLMSLGIGPIVMGSLVTEILVAFKLLDFDLTTHEGRREYMKFTSAMTIVMLIVEAVSTGVRIAEPGIIPIAVVSLLLVFGGYLVILMNEYNRQYGVLSLISLFVLIRVSKSIITSLFNPLPMYGTVGAPAGKVTELIHYIYGIITNNSNITSLYEGSVMFFILMPIFGTILIWVLVAYLDSVKVRIRMPVSGSREYSLMMQTVMPIIFGAFTVAFIRLVIGLINAFVHNPTLTYIDHLLMTPFGYLSWSDKLHWIVYSVAFGIPGILIGSAFSLAFTNEKIIENEYEYLSNFQVRGITRFRKGFSKRINMFSELFTKVLPSVAFYSSVITILLALLGNAMGVASGGSGLILAVITSKSLTRELEYHLKKDRVSPFKRPRELLFYTIKRMFVNEEAS